MDLLLSIIVIYLPTSRTIIGGIIKLSLWFNFLFQKSLSDLEQAKLSEVYPLDWAKVSANVKNWELNMLGEMIVVELFCVCVRFICYFIDGFPIL